MNAVTIVVDTFRMILSNLRTLAILSFWGGLVLTLLFTTLYPVIQHGFPFEGKSIAAFVGLLCAIVVVFVWFAVHWHRALLEDARPAPVWPGVPVRGMLTYVRWSVLVWVLLAIVLLVPGFVLLNAARALIGPITTLPPSFMDIWPLYLASVLGSLLFLYVSNRVAPVLPAAALDRQINTSEAVEATSGKAGIVLAILVLLLHVVAEWLVTVMIGQLPVSLANWVGGAWGAVVALFYLTLLTAIYRNCIPHTEDMPKGPTRVGAF